jgi:hypothetical protein
MGKKDNERASTAARELRELTDRAQRQPGLSQLFSLLEQVQTAAQTVRDLGPVEHPTSGTFSHTF